MLALVAIVLWRYTRSRNLMDVAQDDFVQPKAVRDKFLIALAVLSLSLLFAVTHIQQIVSFLAGYALPGLQLPRTVGRVRRSRHPAELLPFSQILRHLVFRHHAAAGRPHRG